MIQRRTCAESHQVKRKKSTLRFSGTAKVGRKEWLIHKKALDQLPGLVHSHTGRNVYFLVKPRASTAGKSAGLTVASSTRPVGQVQAAQAEGWPVALACAWLSVRPCCAVVRRSAASSGPSVSEATLCCPELKGAVCRFDSGSGNKQKRQKRGPALLLNGSFLAFSSKCTRSRDNTTLLFSLLTNYERVV
jgi:hypothetical protein